MKNKVRTLTDQLQQENDNRSRILEDKDCTKEMYSILVHEYNCTLKILKRLKGILLSS